MGVLLKKKKEKKNWVAQNVRVDHGGVAQNVQLDRGSVAHFFLFFLIIIIIIIIVDCVRDGNDNKRG